VCKDLSFHASFLHCAPSGDVGAHDEFALFYIPTETVVAIRFWRAMLCLARHRETEYKRSNVSFALWTPVVVVELDASLDGAGLIWYSREHGAEVALGVGGVNLRFLGFGSDSSFQNLSEFIGTILAVIGQIMIGLSGRSIALRGDSITALTLAITERPRRSIVSNASMLWTLLCVATDKDVNEITHIAGKDNSNCDRLSRREQDEPNVSVEQMTDEMGIGGTRVVELDSQEAKMSILRMCDPKRTRGSISEFLTLYPTSPTPPYDDVYNLDKWNTNRPSYTSQLLQSPPLHTRPSCTPPSPITISDTGDEVRDKITKRAKGAEQCSVMTRTRKEVASFLGTAVMPSTTRTYNAHFKAWSTFLKDEIDSDDPFMKCQPEVEKIFLVSLMIRRKGGHGIHGCAEEGVRYSHARHRLP
jgi:hypothetical protein